jgi:peroxiredoxin
MILAPGTKAPDFTLKQSSDQQLSLSDLRGRPAVLIFYPADFSPVCGDELALFNEVLDEFKKYDAQVVGISVDGPWCHSAYANQKNLEIPLLSDFEPKGEVSRKYGAYREQDGVSERALFVLDGEGIIRWSYLSPIDQNPGADGVLQALEELHERAASSR